VPWIADLRDPWALDEVMAYPTALHRARELRRMRGLLASAKAVVMNTPEAAREVNSFPEMRTTRVVSIPNGFEPADFDGPPPTRTDDAFRIVHTGYLHTELGREHQRTARLRHALGGTLGSVDLLTRSHVYLLEAVQALRRSGATGGRDIEVHLAGVMSDADREVAAVPGVHLHGYLPHADTIGLMRSADLLFLPMQNLDGGTRSRIVPGKTYEYLASGRPVLAAVPDGDARDLVGSTPGHWLCRPDDVDGMAAAITAQAKLKQAGDPGPGMPAGFERYSRHALAGELAALLDDVAGARRAGRSRVATR
jgi:glycosyltransferase involved in cell wall biosynthesis